MNKFIPLRQFLNEGDSSDKNFGCVMLFADIPDWDELTHRIVREKDVYDPETEPEEYGYEKKPHITLIYGIHHDEILDEGNIFKMIKDIPTLKFSVKEIGVFENDDKPYDVVKFDIDPTKTLTNAREKFLELPNTQTFPDYHPHMTIAYVKKGKGKKYRRILKKSLKFQFDKGVYSDPKYRKNYFDLRKTNYDK